jgi:pyruvate/2-oxoglutarate dehydrogenase complex dihydrolipoamide dehydrogenase (E3) component
MGPVVVLGGGAVGEAFCAALRRRDADVRITLVERELLGGECTYWACMPSKTLLRAPELVAAAARAPGVTPGSLDPERIFWWRDQVVENLDDAGHAEWVAGLNVQLVRGTGRVARPGVLDVDGREVEFEKLVVATGSSPTLPPLEGFDQIDYWTNREATTAHEIPASLVVIGAGPVGCELAQFFARLGSKVTVLDIVDRVLPRDDPDAAEIIAEQLRQDGVELRLGAPAERVEPGVRLHFGDGSTLEAERLLVAAGRTPNTADLGLEQLGVDVSNRRIEVDERLRAAENVWAIGDVNGIAMFTHVGKYQARVAAADLAGEDVRADYRAIPAVTFTDPQLASVGTTQGDGLVSGRWRLPARVSTYERPKRDGFLKLFADAERRVLVGGVAVGPEAGEWLQQVTLAIRAEVSVDVLRDTIQPYPTFSEAVYFAARELDL